MKTFKEVQDKAKKRNGNSQYNLGLMYENGRGVKQDVKKAFEWYQKAAQQGLNLAHNKLGEMYENGRGVKEDDKTAIECYQKATSQDHDNKPLKSSLIRPKINDNVNVVSPSNDDESSDSTLSL